MAFRKAADARGIPVFMWFWDPIDYGEERRRWFDAVAPLFDLVFLNEKGREGMWACGNASSSSSYAAPSVHYVEEGVMVEGDRGPGRRPRDMPPAASGYDVTFQGTVYPYPPDFPRVRIIMALAATRGVDLAVYGPEDMWRELNITSKGMSYGVKSSHIHRASKVSLSLSREQQDVELYRSERLMDGAASGACVLSETFPGLDLLLPPTAVLTANSPQEYVALVRALVKEPAACEPVRNLAMATTSQKALYLVSLYGKFSRALTFENLCRPPRGDIIRGMTLWPSFCPSRVMHGEREERGRGGGGQRHLV
jgi:hypothetical protein